MRVWLIQIDAWDGVTPYSVRMASHDDERLCHLDDKTWWPVIARLPTLRYDFFDGGFDAGSITSPSGDLQASIEAIPALPALALHDARIRIWGGALGDAFEAFALKFDGRVKEQPTVDSGAMSISFAADDGWLDQPLLASYAGTGGAEGGPDLEGQVKPLALGAPRFAPATLIDAVNNIYQLSGYGPIGGVETAFERLNRFGAPSTNTANFTALQAASVERGQWATCLAQGYVRLGAPPEGMLSFHLGGDVTGGWSRFAGDVIRRIATIAGRADRVSAADVAALNASRPWPLSILVTAQTTARELVQRIAMSVNAVAYVDWLGILRLAPLGIGAPTMTLAADGSSLPPVADVRQVAVSAPFWKIAQGAAVTWQVHGLNDIAFNAPLYPRGPYDPAETYREGDMVTLPNGSQWLFIGTVPASGSEPSDENPVWFRLSDAITAGNITYEDGTPVENLKPAEPGATVGGTIGENIYLNDLPDIPAPPGLIRNDLLKLRKDGGLVYQPYGDPAVEVELGKIALPDMGAASESARRKLEDGVNRLNDAIAQALALQDQTRQTVRDAGIYVDPATGTVRIAAIDQTAERVSEAYIRLDAMRGEIVQRATVSYVDGKIAQLVLDPSQFPIYEGIELRVYNAEQRISGAEAAISQKASAFDLSAQGARLHTAELLIDGLNSQITQKVDSVEFNALGERVTSAETTLGALGDTAALTQAVVVARRFPSDMVRTQENALLGLLEGDKANRGALDALASARRELTAGITDARAAVAVARTELIVRIGAAEASALNEARLRIAGDQALATQITNLTVSIDGQLASFDQRIFALSMKDDLITAGLAQTISAVRGLGQDAAQAAENALMTLLSGDQTKREQIGAIAAAREEITALVNGNQEAFVQRISAILARMGVAEASIVAEQLARVTANLAIAAQLSQLSASIGNVDARVALEELARAAEGEALAASVQTLSAQVQDGDAELAAQAVLDRQARVDGDSILASSIDELRAENDDGESAIRAQANLDRQARIDGDLIIAASVDELRAIRDDDIATLLAMNSEERQARIDGDTAVAASVDELRVEKNDDISNLLAINSEERQARIDGDGALSARQDTLSATIDGVTAELTEQAAVLVDLEGRTSISFRIAATDPDGTTYIEIQRQSGSGRILLGGDVITPGSITAQEIEANGITRAFTASNNALIGLTTDMADTATFSVAMARRGSIIINSVQQLVFATGGAWETELTVSDNLLTSGSSNSDHQSVLLGEFYAETPGNYIVRLRARRTAGAVSINAGGARMTILRTYA